MSEGRQACRQERTSFICQLPVNALVRLSHKFSAFEISLTGIDERR